MVNINKKGSRGELEFINNFGQYFPEPLFRNLDQTRDGGADIKGCHPFQIEVKRREKPSLNSWWDQVNKALTSEDEIPVVAYRKNHYGWRFLIPLSMIGVESDQYMELNPEAFIEVLESVYQGSD